jgi:7-cyano-7-deazaguanine synthase
MVQTPVPTTEAAAGPRAVVLLSGGIDSLVAAELALRSHRNLIFLHFRYGQPRAETAAARELARRMVGEQPDFRMVELGDALLKSDGTPANVFAGRNQLFLSCALGVAVTAGADWIVMGCNRDDYADYLDCRPEFFKAFAAVIGHFAPGISIRTPLIHKTKIEVCALGRRLGLPLALTVSCYHGNACGECNACKLRNAALGATSEIKPLAAGDKSGQFAVYMDES